MSLNKRKKKKNCNFFYDFVKVTGAIPMALWFRVKVVYEGGGKKPNLRKGMLVTANHNSMLDPIIVHCALWKRRISCLATTNLYDTKLKSWFFSHIHCIPVDKQNFSMDSFHAVCENLRSDKAVLIFPEGGLNGGGGEAGMLALKSGAVLMAYQANAPILPLYILPRKKWFHRTVVLMGEPINVRDLCGERPSMTDLNRVSEILRQRELELKDKYEKENNK